MGFDIDFLAVGEGERGGDAIAVRWGNLNGPQISQKVMVIDGGTKDSGKALVEHIKKYYGTTKVDYVFCTHPDADHVSGLTEVLSGLEVGVLCMHRPWENAKDLKDLFHNGKVTHQGLKDTLKKVLENAYELETLAKQKNVRIYEPFSDNFSNSGDELIVLSPCQDFYHVMVANFRETPQPKSSVSLFEKAVIAVKEAIKWVAENWNLETLIDPEPNATSAENNSSVVLLLQVEGKKFLFTGDAGVEALTEAINKAKALGIDLKTADFVQIPHHGSKHNVGPTVLNSILGSKLLQPADSKIAFVSVPKEGEPKHPSGKVVNAFIRRGFKVIGTQGSIKRHYKDSPERENWSAAKPFAFYEQVAE